MRERIMDYLVNIMLALAVIFTGYLVVGLFIGAFEEKPTQEQRIEQLEQKCDSLQRQIDFMME